MDKSLFETDAVKVECISRLLRQAEEMLGDVKTHLRDYGERLGPDQAQPDLQNSQIEIERLKQAALEKEEEARVARLERVQALEQVQSLRESVATLQARIDGAEEVQDQSPRTTERLTKPDQTDQQLKILQMENSKLTKELERLKRRLERAHEQNERLLRTREELLDTLKLGDVTITKPNIDNSIPVEETLVSKESLLLESPETATT